MKANEAPNKIYIPTAGNELHYHMTCPNNDFQESVEYTRTDFFIEKAKKWLEEHEGLYEAFDPDSRTYYTDTEAMVTDFENYMKGE